MHIYPQLPVKHFNSFFQLAKCVFSLPTPYDSNRIRTIISWMTEKKGPHGDNDIRI